MKKTILIFAFTLALTFYLNDFFILIFMSLFVLCLILGSKEDSKLNPYYLFAVTPFSAVIYNNSVSWYFLPNLAVNTKIIMAFGMLSFIVGLYISNRRKNYRTKQRKNKVNVLLLLSIGIIPHIIGLFLVGAPILSNDVSEARATYMPNIIGQFTIFLYVALLASIKSKKMKIIVPITFVVFLLSIIKLSQFDIGIFIITIGVGITTYYKQEIKKYSLRVKIFATIVFLVLVLGFKITHELRSQYQTGYDWIESTYVNKHKFRAVENFLQPLVVPYLYLTTPWSNFDFQTTGHYPYRMGMMTLKPLFSWSQLDDIINYDYSIPIRKPPFNTFTYLTDFYLDFGFVGVIILSLFLGNFVAFIYKRTKYSKDIFILSEYIFVAFATFMMFFSNHFTSQGYPFIAVILLESYSYFSRRIR